MMNMLEAGWIRTEERLPMDHMYVLITRKLSNGHIDTIPRIGWHTGERWEYIDKENLHPADRDKDIDVVAWMYLPERYGEVEE